MIKLFEDYRNKDLILKLFQKCKNFVGSIIPDNKTEEKSNKEKDVFWVEYYYGTDVVFDLSVTSGDNNRSRNKIFIDDTFVSGRKLEGKYLILKNYMESVFKKFLEEEKNYFSLDNLTEEIISNINFSKDDYEIFKETERFGL